MRLLVYKKYTLKEPDSRFAAYRAFGVCKNTKNLIYFTFYYMSKVISAWQRAEAPLESGAAGIE